MSRAFWHAKAFISKIPGAHRLYKTVTTGVGEGKVYRIHVGPLKGMRWKRRNALSYWYHLGLYEPHVTRLIEQHLRPGDVFWDVGANAGYHSLVASRVVGPAGHVVAVEADPDVADVLRGQLALNNIQNCTVVQAAVCDDAKTVTFMRHPNQLQSAISTVSGAGVPMTVPCVTLDALLDRFPAPNLMKMDIEGAETIALPHGRRLFEGALRPRMLLSHHGPEAEAFCRQFLEEHGYTLEAADGFEQMFTAVPK